MKATIKELALPASTIISAIIIADQIQPIANQARRFNYCSERYEKYLKERDRGPQSPDWAKANAARICNGGEPF